MVPNTRTFTLRDVCREIYGNENSGHSLRQCFADSNNAYFDSNYKGNKDRLSNFRNYGPPALIDNQVSVFMYGSQSLLIALQVPSSTGTEVQVVGTVISAGTGETLVWEARIPAGQAQVITHLTDLYIHDPVITYVYPSYDSVYHYYF
jgi:hypothetical protein